MLSTKPIANATAATSYFCARGDYYLEVTEALQERTAWLGKGAEALGLRGAVETETFKALLAGELPQGDVLGKWVKGV